MACLALAAQLCAAENSPKVALDNNEALFTVLTAINACGYDSDLSVSDPLRSQIRAEVAKTGEASAEAKESTAVMCSESVWWRCHRRLLADYLVLVHGADVMHLMHDGRLTPHVLTSGVRLVDDMLIYDVGITPPLAVG